MEAATLFLRRKTVSGWWTQRTIAYDPKKNAQPVATANGPAGPWLISNVRQNMARERSFIEAEVILLSKEEGGRSNPVLPVAYGGGLRPHIVLQDRSVRKPKVGMRDGHPNYILDEYLSVAFWSGPDSIPISRPFLLTMYLWCHPDPMYDG